MPDFVPKINAGDPWQTSIPEIVGNIPKLTDAPVAASNNAVNKPYTNGGLNTGQVTALMSGALGMMSDFTNSMFQSRAYNAQAQSYIDQIPLNYAAYRQNVNYLTEQNLQAVSKTLIEGQKMEGAQLAAMGASGFDVSSGDQRIIQDTKSNVASDVYLANRSAYLQAFEMWRSNEMENARLLAAAKMAKVQSKLMKRSGYYNLVSGAINTAAGVMSAAYGPRLKTYTERG